MMLFAAHSGIRYLVLLAGVLTLAYAAFGMATGRSHDRTMQRLASSFAGLIHLQILVGFGVMFSRNFSSILIGHLFMMFFAAAAAQIPASVMRRRPPESRSYTPHLIGTVLAIVCIVAGIMAIGRPIFGSTM